MSAIAERYAAQVAAGDLELDSGQMRVVERLTRLEQELASFRRPTKGSALGWLMARRSVEAPRGIYLWGEVGRGKTMLMDLLFETTSVGPKRRAHFHEFMGDVHERVQRFRDKIKQGENGGTDPIRATADEIADETLLLCFDEFHVTDIADAMILGRLFERLFERGIVLVATSNVAPRDLYLDGLNRALFLPFIEMLESRVDVLQLVARTDFRLEKLNGVAVWHVPADHNARRSIDRAWKRIAGESGGSAIELPLKGRTIHVPRAASGAARFDFADLCQRPLGAADFLRIARSFHTVAIDNIPRLTERDEAKRFILLVDTLYDNGVKLVASAAAEPAQLFTGGEDYEAFEFRRAASRLMEMRSAEYLASPHGRRDSKGSGQATGLVET
jgi:cell division protein ZapE